MKKLLKEWNCLSSFQCSLPIIIKFSEKKHLVCKIPQFGQKLPIQTAHHPFLESGHPYVLSPEESQKKVIYQLMD